ncbi:PREDICTED: ubiquitin-conjugating enzyme E2 U [Chrysochloris asiatica]|uniref:Ubiquitin-conjugating enzyme E2 U n=1 Tax=Chrysochloris asiatica TaxID=185453 RepID=A0A9B0TLD1_CHRAS|nr:PREDICTED: ubiquitin-conjugating enzyme E2 U [Chrysochloris asiatica]
MHCRAYLLLERDYQELMENSYKGIIAFPVSEDLMQWEAEIEGLQHTIWHGLFFQVSINFTSEYNLIPPDVKFRTIPFHPNVDRYTGRPCIDFLDDPDQWNSDYKLSSILLTLQVMLSNPVLENPVNLEAAQMLIASKSEYQMAVVNLFNSPLQLKNDSLMPAKETEEHVSYISRSVQAVSFDEYHETWSGIATSKANEYYRTSSLQDSSFIEKYYKWKKIDVTHPEEWNLRYAAAISRFLKENKTPLQSSLSIRKVSICPAPDQVSPDLQTKLNIVTNIFEEAEGELSPPEYNFSDVSWEEEVDDLVSWAKTLNTDTLED